MNVKTTSSKLKKTTVTPIKKKVQPTLEQSFSKTTSDDKCEKVDDGNSKLQLPQQGTEIIQGAYSATKWFDNLSLDVSLDVPDEVDVSELPDPNAFIEQELDFKHNNDQGESNRAEDSDDRVYRLLNSSCLLTLDKVIDKVTARKTINDGRKLIITQNEADSYKNDLPVNYFKVIKSTSEKIYEKYLVGYLNDAKKIKFKQELRKEIKMTKVNTKGDCFMLALKSAVLNVVCKNADYKTMVGDIDYKLNLLIGPKFNDLVDQYSEQSKNLMTSDFQFLVELSTALYKECGILLNIFCYSDEYVDHPIVLIDDVKEIAEPINIPVSWIVPVFLGTEEVSHSLLQRKETSYVVNLCYNADNITQKSEYLYVG